MPTNHLRTTLYILTLAAVHLVCTGCSAVPRSLSVSQQQEYRTALEGMLAADQQYRAALAWGTTDPKELARLEALSDDEQLKEMGRRSREGIALPPDVNADLMAKQIDIDRENTRTLLEWIDQVGWPAPARCGEGVGDPTGILIHMQMEDVGKALPLLEREVLAGRMPAKKYAVVFDRKRQHEGQPQLYGTSSAFDAATRTVLAPAVVDIEETNRARRGIGLEPLTEYRITSPSTAAGK